MISLVLTILLCSHHRQIKQIKCERYQRIKSKSYDSIVDIRFICLRCRFLHCPSAHAIRRQRCCFLMTFHLRWFNHSHAGTANIKSDAMPARVKTNISTNVIAILIAFQKIVSVHRKLSSYFIYLIIFKGNDQYNNSHAMKNPASIIHTDGRYMNSGKLQGVFPHNVILLLALMLSILWA